VAGSHGIGYHSERLAGYAELAGWPGCHGGVVTLGICSTGAIKPCLSQPDSSIVGQLGDETLREIWEDDRRFARNRRFERAMLDGFCARCPHAMTCRGGCPNLPFATSGSDRDNPFCLYRLEREGRVPPDPLVEGFLP
jgi:radical SAM protein with 4Fe4S-binding SPASM domain